MRSYKKRWGEGGREGRVSLLCELPAEAALDTEIPLRDGMVDRRTHFHDLAFLRVYRKFASDAAVRTDRLRARLLRFVPGSSRAQVVFDFAHQRARGAYADAVSAVHAR